MNRDEYDYYYNIVADKLIRKFCARRNVIKRRFGWTIPQPVWDRFMRDVRELIAETGGKWNPDLGYVDNLAVNGRWQRAEDLTQKEIKELLDEGYEVHGGYVFHVSF